MYDRERRELQYGQKNKKKVARDKSQRKKKQPEALNKRTGESRMATPSSSSAIARGAAGVCGESARRRRAEVIGSDRDAT